MKVCPKCGARITQAVVRGPLVWATAPVVFEDGIPKATGPIVAQATIKPGHEITSKGVVMDCSQCTYCGPINSFRDIVTCYISGDEISEGDGVRIQMLPGNSVIVSAEFAEDVQRATNATLEWYKRWSSEA